MLKNPDIKEFATIFGFILKGQKEGVVKKLIALKTSVPTPLYLELYEISTMNC